MPSEMDFLANTLRMLAKELQSISNEDLEAVNNGRAKLRLSVELVKGSNRSRSETNSQDFTALVESLGSCESRDAVSEQLDRAKLSKTDLQNLTRILDLPHQKDDNMARLQERIIESVIGFRLRSRAIQGATDQQTQTKGQ